MGENRKIYAALLGAGTVGSGVYKLAGMQEEDICLKTGAHLEIKKILVRNPGKVREGIPQELFTDSWQEILEDPEIQIVIEVMGGIEPARTYVEEAMKAGKQVVTANKDLLAEYGDPLFEIATENKCDLQFEAAVAGAIPIIRPLRQSLAGSQLTEIMGIVNGTTNYILTKMSEEGMDYQKALDMATRLGYAEADPTADVEGYDTCRKIAILTSLAFGSTVKFEEIQTEGITKISTADFAYAEKLGCVVKLLATSFKKDEKVYAITAPFLIDATHPLYNVNDVLNGIYIHGNVIGDVMFFGAGAGKLPTASAVVADVVDCVKHKGRNVMTLWSYEKLELGSAMEVERTFFVRIKDRAALEKAKEAFHAVQTVTVDGLDDEFGLVTANMTEQAFAQAAAQFDVAGRIRFDKTTI